jgi:alpha-galactosidase
MLSPTPTDPTDYISMLKNSRVIAIDQDTSGVQGTVVSQSPPTSPPTLPTWQVWGKRLSNGDRAVALFNTGSSSQQISTSARAVGMPRAGQYRLLNVWTNQTSSTKNNISATVPADGVVLYRVTAG